MTNNRALVERSWIAKLDLGYSKRRDKTCLTQVAHLGPLRVQRAFYPEGDSCAHTYLLHPPGGLVNGDSVEINITLDANTHALITTPSAGKAYRSLSSDLKQTQSVSCSVGDGAVLEWLPPENIIFDGANVELALKVDLAPTAKLICWEFTCLGRFACDERFDQGHASQLLQITQNDQISYRELTHFSGGSDILDQPWGLNGFSCLGTLICTYKSDDEFIENLRESTKAENGVLAMTQRGDYFIARYLGDSAEDGRALFIEIWNAIRPLMLGVKSCYPRIWNT